MREPAFVSAVVYTRNEEQTVEQFLTRLDTFLGETFDAHEIIVVNDLSQDRTRDVLKRAADTIKGNLTLITLSRRHGLELGILAGLDRSVGDFVFELESTEEDFPLELLLELYKKACTGYDIVAASPSRTPLASRFFYKLVSQASYLDLNLSTETARVVSRRALNAMLNLREKVRYRKALYAFTGYARTQVTYEPKQSRSRRLNRETITLALDIMVSFSDWGLRVAHTLSFVFLAFSVGMGIYVGYNWAFRDVVEGWTTIMAMLSLGFSGIFFILGLHGEYITRILTEVQNRPLYTVLESVVIAAKSVKQPEHGAPAEREAESA